MTATATRKRFPRITRKLSTGETISLSLPSKMPCYGWAFRR